MSNTAQYQCSCGFSTNNEWVWNQHVAKCRSRVNWNERIVAAVLGVVVALSLLMPAKAQSVGEPPVVAVEHKVFLPFVAAPEDVSGQGRYWGGQAVSWCPGCNPAVLHVAA